MPLLRPAIFPLSKLTPLPPAKMVARAANSTPPDRRMSMKDLLQAKHLTVWIESEEGLIDESKSEGMRDKGTNLEGLESLLQRLKENNYEIHAFTNYPIWQAQAFSGGV